jgi:UDP-N-acetylmuramoyl-L-alanine---L-glutamate ligase
MRFAELAGKRVAVWGFGREGRAALAALHAHLPGQALTLFCGADEATNASAFFEGQGIDAAIHTQAPDAEALSAFDAVVKSPGISAYRPELLEAQAQGTIFTSGTALWFAAHPQARTIAVTGTKGKSTTTAMLAHLARSLGVRTALAGNIGLPLLELDGEQADLWAIELSSFQTSEASDVELGVITSLYEEHLDWHGSRERYVTDKLRLADVSRQLLVNALQPALLERTATHAHRSTFGDVAGWHVAEGHIFRGKEPVFDIARLAAPGLHNAINACAALAALELMGMDARAAAPALATFRPLPHRLQPLGERDGLTWVNDSISTTPQATLAALESLQGQDIALIVGGHDRGLDWSDFVNAMRQSRPKAIICQGANGGRIADALAAADVCPLERVAKLEEAVTCARVLLNGNGCVLLSPGAPSFDQFHDYADRGRRFAELAGFDAEAFTGIDGLGVH